MNNPYVYREPLKGRAGFYNRISELTRIISRSAADGPQSVSVVGPPRTGKTSLINYLCDPAQRAQDLDDPSRYVYLCLYLREDPPGSPEAFFARMQAALQRSGQGAMGPGYDGFLALVEQLMQEGRKLVLFLDDFDQVTLHRGFPLDFFSFMRSIANSNDVGYVTTSYEPLQQLCYAPAVGESPFFNIFTTVNLEAFEPEEALKLVERPAREAGSPFGQEVDWILELGGTSPYLLQLTASVAFEERAQGRLDRELLAARAFGEAREYLELIWEKHFPRAQLAVLRALATGKVVERRHQHAAGTLERRGYLRRNGEGYLFTSALLKRFVKEGERGGFWKRLFGCGAAP